MLLHVLQPIAGHGAYVACRSVLPATATTATIISPVNNSRTPALAPEDIQHRQQQDQEKRCAPDSRDIGAAAGNGCPANDRDRDGRQQIFAADIDAGALEMAGPWVVATRTAVKSNLRPQHSIPSGKNF
jgi:hypothetical protein